MTIYQRIIDIVNERKLSTVTFDVFDTLVFRHVNYPTALFEKIVASVPALEGIPGEDYRILREQAERAARGLASDAEEVTLEEIFHCLPFDEQTRHALLDAELAAENSYSMLNQALCNVIETLIDQGVTVALISDMYLSAKQITDTFLSSSENLCRLPLFVSSEYKKTKHSGNLFRLLAEQQGWSYQKWLHIGDNDKADVGSPGMLGINTLHFHPLLDANHISAMEVQQYHAASCSSATRLLASLQSNGQSREESVAFELGAFVWGPVFDAFANWVIQQSKLTGCKHILCLMREGYLFTPLIEKKLALMGQTDLSVSAFYVSRKSAFWPGIDTSQPQWLENVMDTLMMYRGYSLSNFIRDFQLSEDILSSFSSDLELKNIEGLFVEGESLYARLYREAKANSEYLKNKIRRQKSLLMSYLEQETQVRYSQCAVVDFGNGGTIQHSLENIFAESAGANLLFYASLRAYRFVSQTYYRAFISEGTERFSLSKNLSRSPECIEALLLGDKGSTLSYERYKGSVEPVLAEGIPANKAICEQFLAGCLTFLQTAYDHNQPVLNGVTSQAVVSRYLMMPTADEAGLFTKLYHQDNFGTDGEYPIIDDKQVEKVKQHGLETTLFNVLGNRGWELGIIHWPAGVIAIVDDAFIPRSLGLLANDNKYYIRVLLDKLQALGWTSISVYGAGEFFREMLPFFNAHGIQVLHVVDRKAETGEVIIVDGYKVITIHDALDEGANRFIVSSLAFGEEITKNIQKIATQKCMPDVQIISI
ncbi:MAG: hypothetical protein Alis2KO_42150 [Aliiglaciecola sp.]